MKETKSFFDELQRIACPFGFGHGWTNEAGHHFSFGGKNACFPITINAEHKRDDEFFVYGHIRTYGLAGCRTDLHDWIGSLWAICCRGLDLSSVWILDEGGYALDKEIYARIVVFSQPNQSSYRITDEPDRLELGKIFAASHVFAHVLSDVWCAGKISVNDEFDYGEEAIPADLLTAFSAEAAETPRSTEDGQRASIIIGTPKRIYRSQTSGNARTGSESASTWVKGMSFDPKGTVHGPNRIPPYSFGPARSGT